MVELKNLYLLIGSEVMATCLNNEENIYFCYYPEKNKLLLSPVTSPFFSKIHKSQSAFLKLRNAQGTRSFQLASIFLDNPDLSEQDRVLKFEANTDIQLLTVYL